MISRSTHQVFWFLDVVYLNIYCTSKKKMREQAHQVKPDKQIIYTIHKFNIKCKQAKTETTLLYIFI